MSVQALSIDTRGLRVAGVSMPRVRQNMSAYSEVDQQVWKKLFHLQMAEAAEPNNKLWEGFLLGIQVLRFDDSVPDLMQINKRLMPITGWQAVPVDGKVDVATLFELLRQRKQPVSVHVRRMDEVDFAKGPDIFHDAFGHLPCLTNLRYATFLHSLAVKAGGANTEEQLEAFNRIYFRVCEFSGIRTPKGDKVFGAAIASSHKETENFFKVDPSKRPMLDVESVLDVPNEDAGLQTGYPILCGLEQLDDITGSDW